MNAESHDQKVPRDAGNWAANVERLHVADDEREFGYNIEGKRVAGPMQGFGRLWQRTYSADLGTAVTPERLVANWRAHFGDYWPSTGRWHGAVSSIRPGDVAPFNASGIVTGVMVLYADDTSFSFLTPEGHMFASMITFSGESTADGGTRAQIRMLLRTSDPLWEAAWPIARRAEDVFWPGTLGNLATDHGVSDAVIVSETLLLDRRRMWKNWSNVWHNAGIRTAWHTVTSPFRRRERSVA
jgi:hypothetical protein